MLKELDERINCLINSVGKNKTLSSRKFLLGKKNLLEGAIVFIEGFADNDIIKRDILTPLMDNFDEEIIPNKETCEFISKRYIITPNTKVEYDIENISDSILLGNTVIVIDGYEGVIVADTKGGEYRSITDPVNESAITGTREGFVENIYTNISLIRRNIKDKNLSVLNFKIGVRSQTDLALIYIDDIVDKKILEELEKRINKIDVDSINDSGILKQYIADSPYSPFPQVYSTERPDTITASILEGRIALVLDRSPQVLSVPSIFIEFFQATEDYSQGTLNASFARLLRLISIPLILTLPSIYLALITYNVELIPVKLVSPLIESRRGVYLNPFLEIFLMEVVVELLREGGLRLPPKIAQTLSIVGGIIIGNTAIQSRVVSPITLLIIGFTTIATFVIRNYEMSLSLRLIRFPILILTDILGFLGIISAMFILIMHLSALKSINVEYFELNSNDMQDTFIRAQHFNMKRRPASIPNNNPVRQWGFRRKKDGKE